MKTNYASSPDQVGLGTIFVGTLQSRLFAKCDFICDGVDDHVEIQQAIDLVKSLPGKFGTIVFLEGTYQIGASIRLYENVNLKGLGMKTTVFTLVNNVNDVMFYFDESTVDPSAGLLIEDIFFSGNDSGNTASSFLDTKRGSIALWDVHIIRCFFFNFVNDVIYIKDPWGFRFSFCHIEDCQAGGILITAGASKTNGIIITNNKIIQNSGHGIKLAGVRNAMIQSNEINASNAQNGIELNSSFQNSIIGNQFFGGVGNTKGIHCDSASAANAIVGNNFAGGYDGIVIDASAVNNIITSNTFASMTGTSITDNGTGTINANNSLN